MLTWRAQLTNGLGLAFATKRAIAHHSTAMYDMANPATVKGSVTGFEWTNPLPLDPNPFWVGHSLGRWDGDSLVVDSVGFKGREISGYKTTEALHVVERFRRPNPGTLEYEAVIEDPNVCAAPALITRTFPLPPEFTRVDLFFGENNVYYTPLFGK
jgi:hypothetical protein